jgi:hypothetical protein
MDSCFAVRAIHRNFVIAFKSNIGDRTRKIARTIGRSGMACTDDVE